MEHPVPKIRLSAFYLAYFSILGVLLPYWLLYLQEAGYDSEHIGWIMAIIPATKIVSPSFWGWLADHFRNSLRLIRLASLLAFAGFSYIILGNESSRVTLLYGMLVFSFCWNGTMPLFDAFTLDHLHRHVGFYSRLRLWGSVGFILSVWGMGRMLDASVSLQRLPEIILALLLVQWLVSLMIPPVRETHTVAQNLSMLKILKRPEVISLLLATMLLQVSHGPYYSFYSVFLSGHGVTDDLIGELWALGVIAEIVVFVFLHQIFRYLDSRALFLGSLALSSIRWLIIGWGVDSLPALVVAQIFHAATFGSAHAAAIHIVHRNFRGPHHAKGQALYSGICFGLGGAMGSYYSGLFWGTWGPVWVFSAAAGFSLLGLVIAWPGVGREAQAVAG